MIDSLKSSPPADGERASRLSVGLLLAPLVLHVVATAVGLAQVEPFEFRERDGWLLVVAVLYAALVAFAVRDRRRARRVCLLVYGALIPILGAELVTSALRPDLEAGLPRRPVRRVSLAADTMPGIQGEIVFSVGLNGLRGPDTWPASRDDRILCVGGSTTECLYVTDENSWPWVLGKKLTQARGGEVLVANAGRSGHLAAHHAFLLKHYVHAKDFGTVIVLCGINDVGTFLRGTYAERSARVPEEALSGGRRPGPYYRSSAIITALSNLKRSRVTTVEQDPAGHWLTERRALRRVRLAKHPISTVPPGLDAAVERYAADLRQIVEACDQNEQRLIFVTQPTLYGKDMPADLAALIYQFTETAAHTPAVLEQVNAAFNRTLQRVAKYTNVECIDLAALLPKDTSVFYDDCHFNTAGCETVAEIVAKALTR